MRVVEDLAFGRLFAVLNMTARHVKPRALPTPESESVRPRAPSPGHPALGNWKISEGKAPLGRGFRRFRGLRGVGPDSPNHGGSLPSDPETQTSAARRWTGRGGRSGLSRWPVLNALDGIVVLLCRCCHTLGWDFDLKAVLGWNLPGHVAWSRR